MQTAATLSSAQRKRAQKVHNIFQFINNFSFLLVNGSILTLYALKAGAPVVFLGLISALNFFSFMCVPLGHLAARYIGVVRVYAWAWLLRYLSMIPVLGVPFFLVAGKNDIAINLMLIASVGFNLFRGIGMAGNNPVIAAITTEKERSRYIALVFMLTFLASMISALFLVFVLKIAHDSIWAYAGLFFIGIVCGVWASCYVFHFPEAPKPEQKQNFLHVVHQVMRRQSFRIFIITYFGISFTMAMVRPFAVVYTKEVYNQNDSASILYTSIGFLGSLLMGAFSRLTVNFVGTKTLYIFYMSMSIISLVPVIVSPDLTGISLVVFLLVFHFISNLGMQGVESNSQTYLFGVIRPKEVSEVFTFYYIVYGLAGGIGAILGGELLNMAHKVGLTPLDSYRAFFLLVFSLFVLLLFLLARLQNTSKHSVTESLGYIFSMRDMKALSLANKLEESSTFAEQMHILQEMTRSESEVSEDFLLETLSSPREEIRHQALYVIESMPALKDKNLIMVLINELHSSVYTTAYIAARILGRMKITRSIPEMRLCLKTEDYRLQAEALFALGRMKDQKSLPIMLELLRPGTNPYVLVKLFAALEKLLPPGKVRLLFQPLYWRKARPELCREALLSASFLMGISESFYPFYCTFLKNPHEAYQSLLEYYQTFSHVRKREGHLPADLFNPETKGRTFMNICGNIWDQFFPNPKEIDKALRSAVNNPLMIRHESFRFLIAVYLTKKMDLEKTHPKLMVADA